MSHNKKYPISLKKYRISLVTGALIALMMGVWRVRLWLIPTRSNSREWLIRTSGRLLVVTLA